MRKARRGIKIQKVRFDDFDLTGIPGMEPHEVWVGRDILDQVAKAPLLLKHARQVAEPHAVILADRRLGSSIQSLQAGLESQGWKIGAVIRVNCDESLKSWNQMELFHEKLQKAHATRQTVLFALGGGVIGDIAGFLAGTYMRGIRWVGIPTTLLAQVDSCLGGKAGVNLSTGKNLAGVFHHPAHVVCDLQHLDSLSQRDLYSGWAEIIKYGLLFDPGFLKNLQKDWGAGILAASDEKKAAWVATSLKWKAQIVSQDPFEKLGRRELLNFGHTLGHALEKLGGYGTYRHGEAVAWGMRAALRLSVLRGHMKVDQQDDLDSYLKEIPLPALPKGLRFSELWECLNRDKKVQKGRLRWILLQKSGSPVIDDRISPQEVQLVWSEMCEKY